MSRALASLITVAALLCGCGTAITFTPLGGNARFAPKPAEEVDVFLTEPPARAHRDVGLFEVQQESDLSQDDTASMLRQLRKAAGDMGCDAVFIKRVGNDPQQNPLVNSTAAVKAITATCLRYTDPAAASAAR
jgi:hypothetical protein